MRLSFASLVSLVVLLPACYGPNIPNGAEQCSASGKCPEGFMCFPDKHCYKAGSIPMCSPPCAGATPICDKTMLRCVGCLADGDCPAGSLCKMQKCMAGCSSMHSTCGADGGSCDVDMGVCRGCLTDKECGGATPRCNAGTCVACLPNQDNCPSGSFCAQVGSTYSCQSGCQTAADCGGASDGGVPDGGSTTMACCAHRCVDTSLDGQNCGGCGAACGASRACCASACADLTSDVSNCGGCGMTCAFQNATAICNQSKCAVGQCSTGYKHCDATAVGCETNITSDSKNCGDCGLTCGPYPHAAAACTSSLCSLGACEMNFADCNSTVSDGCETSLNTDPSNCGSCKNVCAVQANSTGAVCATGKCGLAGCVTGFGDCNGVASDGCEINLSNDPNNCGACAHACSAGQVCASGACMTTSLHDTVSFVGGSGPAMSCEYGYNTNQGPRWDNLGMLDWKTCVVEASKRGAMLFSNNYGSGVTPGWHGHRLGNVAMTGQWANYISADISSKQNCVVARDPRAQSNNAPLSSSVTYDGMFWRYQDFGMKFYDECTLLAANAGAIIITPWTLGLGNGDNYWSDSVHLGNTYEWITGSGTSFANDNLACSARSSSRNCMVGYPDAPGAIQPTCLAIKGANPQAPDGVYTIDPDGPGGKAPVQVYCDMTTDGGGWMVMIYIRNPGQWSTPTFSDFGAVGDVTNGFASGATLRAANPPFTQKIIIYKQLVENNIALGVQWMENRRADSVPLPFASVDTPMGWNYFDSFGYTDTTNVLNACSHGCTSYRTFGMFHDYSDGVHYNGTQGGDYGCRDGNNICWEARSLGCNVGSARCANLIGAGEGVVYGVR